MRCFTHFSHVMTDNSLKMVQLFSFFLWIKDVKSVVQSYTKKCYIFLELSCFFYDPKDIGNLISGSSAFSKSSLNIWKFSVHVLLKPCLENFEHYFASAWDECNFAVVWTFFDIAFLWDWNENLARDRYEKEMDTSDRDHIVDVQVYTLRHQAKDLNPT